MHDKENIEFELKRLDKEIQQTPDCSALYFERGKLRWKLGRKAEAMTDYNIALSLDPHSSAKSYLDMANDIMDFYNTDLYNP